MILPIQTNTIKTWLEGFGLPVAREAFPVRDELGVPNRVNVPFIVFSDRIDADGSDLHNFYRTHSVTIELYTENGDDSDFDAWLYSQNIHYSCDQSYVAAEQLYVSIFSIEDDFIEKETNTNG
jgi:hypothetical protein